MTANVSSDRGKLVLAALLGAAGGGLVVVLATRAIPRLMGRAMSQVIQSMSAHTGEESCNPADI